MKRSIIGRVLAGIVVLGLLGAACSTGNDAGSSDAATPSGAPASMTSVALDEGAIALQQGLTSLLDGHVYLASIAISTGLATGLDSPEFEAAAATLDRNSQDLADAIGSVYGKDAGTQFLKLWRAHIGMFVDYTEGKATGNEKQAKQALANLDGYRKDFGAFIDSATDGNLPADAVASSLQMHVNSLVQAIDQAVAGDPMVFDSIYVAAKDHMPMTASALAGGIAAQMPEEFPTA